MRVSASKNYIETITWNTKDLAEGSTLEGVYKAKETFIGQNGETTKYIIEGADGTNYGVYDSATLNRQFAVVPEGSYVWITYNGVTTSKNGRTVKLFAVDYDTEYNQ